MAKGRYAEAEPLYLRTILEKAFGPDDPLVGRALSNLADLYESQGRYAEAELYTYAALPFARSLAPITRQW